ncbi:isocitrate lyase/PEP mutase family protein [Limoniibacter endophyticus]|uniref:2-methylisocitrate lyase n=1 Tax=Limoniibacter endophyticus TaxID=1565040 RepID=A0A8J3DH30_9HYPH|nr:isocitrate lyase/phosphoenolpyruvate mutase family protein [Limoniibacter endophyticus]GHC66343.1 isocitrate lyase-family enzyme [Limoniibacter endophyticus]
MNRPTPLGERLKQKEIVVAPGVYDALTASLAEAAGFEAAYVSGANIAYTRLGGPDIGLVSMTEVANTIQLIRDRVALNLIVDADTGYGNALNTQRTMRLFERAGANAIQLEDQTFPKRCGHLSDKKVIPAAEMAGKIKAAADARESTSTLIIGRTDALAIEGYDAAIDRAGQYIEAGADAIFVEAPRSMEQMKGIVDVLGSRAPLLANMVEGGRTPIKGASELEDIGFSLVIFPGAIVRAIAKTAQEFYQTLRKDGTTAAMRDRMFDFDGLNDVIGTAKMLETGQRYES